MKIKVRDVRPNPYRNIDHYPLNKEKIMALTSSIEKTGFWDNLVAREVNGEVQIAYGHHRIEALRLAKGCGYDFEFDLPIKDIDDGTMIQIMANENMQEWGHSIVVTDETVKVAKKFLEESHMPFSGNQHKKNIKYRDLVSSSEIADFLGWNQSKVSSSLKRMDLIESGKVDKKAVESLPTETHAVEFAKAVSNTDLTPKEQSKIAEKISSGGHGKRDVKKIVAEADFEKKYPNAGKKKDPNKEKIKTFDYHLNLISDKMGLLANDFIRLNQMKDEILNYTDSSITNREIFFSAIGNLQRKINRLLETLATEEEKTEFNNNLKLK